MVPPIAWTRWRASGSPLDHRPEYQFRYLAGPGIAMLGIGWLGAAGLAPTRRLAVLGLVLGVVALFEAVDDGIVMVPFPIGPVWVRLLLESAWIALAIGTLVKSNFRQRSAETAA
jgi:hypothetical protein